MYVGFKLTQLMLMCAGRGTAAEVHGGNKGFSFMDMFTYSEGFTFRLLSQFVNKRFCSRKYNNNNNNNSGIERMKYKLNLDADYVCKMKHGKWNW